MLKGSRSYEDAEVEFVLVDLQDAFCRFGVHAQELKHCISPGMEHGSAILWVECFLASRGPHLSWEIECSHRAIGAVFVPSSSGAMPGLH